MSETLYPHEVIHKFVNKNICRLLSITLFIFGGIYLCKSLESDNIFRLFGLMIFVEILMLGYIAQYLDYKSRGLN